MNIFFLNTREELSVLSSNIWEFFNIFFPKTVIHTKILLKAVTISLDTSQIINVHIIINHVCKKDKKANGEKGTQQKLIFCIFYYKQITIETEISSAEKVIVTEVIDLETTFKIVSSVSASEL